MEMGRTGLRERAKRDKLRRIENAARRLFKRGGYESTTTRAIANAAGIGVGTLYLYFPEKLDLLAHLYRQDLERITGDAMERLPPATSLVDGCMSVFEPVFEFWARDAALARVFVRDLLFASSRQQREPFEVIMRLMGQMGALVAACQARGELRPDVAPQFVANEIFGRYFWYLMNWLAGRFPPPPQLTALLRMSLELLVRGLRP